MAFSNAVYGVISQVVDQLYERQDKKREKANTWVVGIGTIIAALLSGATYLLQSGAEGLPEWLAPAVVVLTMIGTLFGVSKTKNGVTQSLRDQINTEIADMIDAQEGQKATPHIPAPAAPTTGPEVAGEGSTAVQSTDGIADDLDALAKRLANRQG